MKSSSLHALGVVLALLAPRAVLAEEKADARTDLDPLVVTGIRPLIKIAEHPMVEPRFAAAVVAEGDYLYIIGGSNHEGTRLDTVERVDLRTGRAAPWARLQVARRHHRAVILEGKIYVLGGTSGETSLDPLTDELSDYYGEDPPPGITYTNFFAIENLLRKGSTHGPGARYLHEATMEIIDLATGRVSPGPAMPVGKAMFGCVVVDGKILVIGGQKRRGDTVRCTNTTEVFDPADNTWSPGINMPTPRRGTATLVDGFVMFLGGHGGASTVRTVEVFSPRDKVWRRLPDLTEAVNPSATVWTGRYLFLFGDQNYRTRQLVYDLRSKQLVPYPLALPDSDFAAALLHQKNIYVVGGASLRKHDATEAIQIFAPAPEVYAATTPGNQ